jgi:hypothetical protein
MIQQNGTLNVGSSTAWATNEWTLCTNRLPCGVCRLMQIMCPMAMKTCDVSWTNFKKDITTCNVEVQE